MDSVLRLYEEIESIFPERVTIKKLNRGDILIRKGEIERNAYIVLSGALRVIHYRADKEQNIRFGYRGSYVSSIPSFFDDSPSAFNIEAIRKTEVKCFQKGAFFELLRNKENAIEILIELISSLSHQFVEREMDLLTNSPKELYERVLKRSPILFQEIPALHIANYLGMSPEHLSRLRKS